MSVVHSRRSNATGRINSMELSTTEEKLNAWLLLPRGERPFVQSHFPELNADEREFLISGTTPTEWDDLFGKDPEENLGDDVRD